MCSRTRLSTTSGSCCLTVITRAKYEADGWVLALEHPVLARVVEVEVHLTSVRMRKAIQLQVDDDQTAQLAMEGQQIHPVPSLVDMQPKLPPDEGEALA